MSRERRELALVAEASEVCLRAQAAAFLSLVRDWMSGHGWIAGPASQAKQAIADGDDLFALAVRLRLPLDEVEGYLCVLAGAPAPDLHPDNT